MNVREWVASELAREREFYETAEAVEVDYSAGMIYALEEVERRLPPEPQDGWPKLLWVCDHCGHWHGASYNTWPEDKPPTCKIRGYGRDGKRACGEVMRAVPVEPSFSATHNSQSEEEA